MIALDDAYKNKLLARLPLAELRRLAPRLRLVHLASRDPLYSSGQPIRHVYFPIDAVISMIAEVSDGKGVEISTVGREGFIGLPVFLGADRTNSTAFTQVPGDALCMTSATLRAATKRSGVLRHVLHLYTQALFMQVAQAAGCLGKHPIEQRCARWLAMTHDRVGRDEFPLTHEFLAQMLAVRRATVSEVAARLQRQGVIRYRRGVVRVEDRAKLTRLCCACYAIMNDEFERLFGEPP